MRKNSDPLRGVSDAESAAHDARLLRGWLAANAIWSALGAANLLLGGPGGVFTLVMLQAMTLGGLPACAVHEGGHALAARMLGAVISEVRLGRGPAVARLRLGSAMLEVGRYAWLGGATRMAWPARTIRWRLAAVMLAGPLLNLGAAALAFRMAAFAPEGGLAQALLAGAGLAQLGAGVFNLLPAPATESQPATDGAQAWAAIAGR